MHWGSCGRCAVGGHHSIPCMCLLLTVCSSRECAFIPWSKTTFLARPHCGHNTRNWRVIEAALLTNREATKPPPCLCTVMHKAFYDALSHSKSAGSRLEIDSSSVLPAHYFITLASDLLLCFLLAEVIEVNIYLSHASGERACILEEVPHLTSQSKNPKSPPRVGIANSPEKSQNMSPGKNSSASKRKLKDKTSIEAAHATRQGANNAPSLGGYCGKGGCWLPLADVGSRPGEAPSVYGLEIEVFATPALFANIALPSSSGEEEIGSLESG